MSWIKTYGKSLAAGAALVVTAAQAALSDGHLTQAEDLQICIALATAAGVYLVPAVPRWPQTKTLVAFVLAMLEVAVTLIDNGVSSADWTAIILGGLTVITVGAAPAVVHKPSATISTGGSVADMPASPGE